MLRQIGLGAMLVLATTLIHAVCTGFALHTLATRRAEHWARRSHLMPVLLVAACVLLLFFASTIEAALWASMYVYLGAIAGFEEAFYFSMVAFTTLGFGDVTLHEQWRLIGAFEAATGTIMFGWSTALVFAFIQRAVSVRRSSD